MNHVDIGRLYVDMFATNSGCFPYHILAYIYLEVPGFCPALHMGHVWFVGILGTSIRSAIVLVHLSSQEEL